MEKFQKWIGAAAALVTVSLTVLNALWSRDIQRLQSEFDNRKIALEADRDRLARYEFVQGQFQSLLQSDDAQRVLTVNLIRLALTGSEADSLFAGFRASASQAVRNVGELGISSIRKSAVANLVGRIDAPSKSTQQAAVQQLIEDHHEDPEAVKQAVELLEPGRGQDLSPGGRVRALEFLQTTDSAAWNTDQVNKAQAAVARIERPEQAGSPPVRQETKQTLDAVSERLLQIRKDLDPPEPGPTP
jgi:hypothetical protein